MVIVCRNFVFLEWLSLGVCECDGSDIKFSYVGEIENEIFYIFECDIFLIFEC